MIKENGKKDYEITISQFIEKLEKIREAHGEDLVVSFLVRDHYSAFSYPAHVVTKNYDPVRYWAGTSAVNDCLKIALWLENDHEGKKPKITFRS